MDILTSGFVSVDIVDPLKAEAALKTSLVSENMHII